MVKNLPTKAGNDGDWVQSLGRECLLEAEMATHSSILPWRIPGTEEPGRLQSTGLQSWPRLKQLSTHARALTFC